MDNLTHGLLGLAVGASRQPLRAWWSEFRARGTSKRASKTHQRSADPEQSRAEIQAVQTESLESEALTPPTSTTSYSTERAVLIACILAAEFPDIDVLLMLVDPVHHALVAHRAWTHTLMMAPLIAGVAAAIPWVFDRRARFSIVWLWSLLSLSFAHLLADLWTGWGIRLFLPFSNLRWRLDWTMVVDPWLTLPLVVGGVLALFFRKRGRQWRRPMLWGLAVAFLYLGGRLGLKTTLQNQVQRHYPQASVAVFPKFLSVFEWRYVVKEGGEQIAGGVNFFRGVNEQGRYPQLEEQLAFQHLPEHLAQHPYVQESLDWAQFSVLDTSPRADGGTEVKIADLRYHWSGEPTLAFVLDFDPEGNFLAARLDRGGNRKQLMERMRRGRGDE